jgi:hypothetical protein
MNRLQELLQSGFHLPSREVRLRGEPFLLDEPVSEPELAQTLLSRPVGAVLTFMPRRVSACTSMHCKMPAVDGLI